MSHSEKILRAAINQLVEQETPQILQQLQARLGKEEIDRVNLPEKLENLGKLYLLCQLSENPEKKSLSKKNLKELKETTLDLCTQTFEHDRTFFENIIIHYLQEITKSWNGLSTDSEAPDKGFSLQPRDPQILEKITQFVDNYQKRWPQAFLSFGDIGLRQASIDHMYNYSQNNGSLETNGFINRCFKKSGDESLRTGLKSYFRELEELWGTRQLKSISSVAAEQKKFPNRD